MSDPTHPGKTLRFDGVRDFGKDSRGFKCADCIHLTPDATFCCLKLFPTFPSSGACLYGRKA